MSHVPQRQVKSIMVLGMYWCPWDTKGLSFKDKMSPIVLSKYYMENACENHPALSSSRAPPPCTFEIPGYSPHIYSDPSVTTLHCSVGSLLVCSSECFSDGVCAGGNLGLCCLLSQGYSLAPQQGADPSNQQPGCALVIPTLG